MKQYIGWSQEGCQAQKLLSLWKWNTPNSKYIYVFTNVESLWSLYFWYFYEDFITKAWWNINSISSPSPLSRGRWSSKFQPSKCGLAFLVTGSIQEPFNHHLIRIKGSPITQDIPGDLGVLSGTGVKKETAKPKMLLVSLSLRKLWRPETGDRDQ